MKKHALLAISLLLLFVIPGCSLLSVDGFDYLYTGKNEPTALPAEAQNMTVHFIDVGQADAIFIDYGDTDILIDAGNKADGSLVVEYLNALETDDIELLIATHPHEDHIGGMESVLNAFEVEQIIKPAVSATSKVSKVFEMLIAEKNIPVKWPEQGDQYPFGDMVITILSDRSKNYSDLNNLSLVIRLDHGENSFIFTGDAESEAEHDIVASGMNLKADVLKVGHHGSGTSTTAQFAKKISPQYAIISVGAGNSYGHPDKLITDRLSLLEAEIWQTHESGTIMIESDGKTLSVSSSR
jgi:competence protein ComEC